MHRSLLLMISVLLFPLVSSIPAAPEEDAADGLDLSFDPSTVAVAAVTDEEKLSIVLREAGAGNLETAASMIERLLNSAQDDASRERAKREKERLTQLIAMRDAAFVFLRDQNKRATLRFDGRSVNGFVKEISDQELTVEDHRGKKTMVPITSIDPGQLATLVKSKKIPAPAGWVPGYANLLSDKKDRLILARKAFKGGAGSQVKALEEDIESYDALRTVAADLTAMVELFETAAPRDGKSADAVLAAIRAVVEQDNVLVARHREDLGKFAGLALAKKFEEDGLAALGLRGKTKASGDTLTLTYDCGKAATLEDFEVVDDYLADFRQPYGDLPDVSRSIREATDAGLLLRGKGCLRHKLELDAPMTVRFGLEYSYEESMQPGPIEVRIGICDDGERNFISSSNAGDLLVYDGASRFVKQVRSPLESIQTDQSYEFEIAHDGERVTISNDGEELTSEGVGGRKSGRLFLWYHANVPTRLVSLEIEGTFAQDRLIGLRDEWVASEMERLFR